ncbi:hypothetical protein ACIPJN_11815 [Streptomyces sp. NPDC086796]|uniref:hypothetical protein n=1 Tax=unclassified Streptomyces TaxID=2593676 RepID=UPI00380C47B2
MSPRAFARHFQATTGTTPLRWLITQRIAAAQKLLERTGLPSPRRPAAPASAVRSPCASTSPPTSPPAP